MNEKRNFWGRLVDVLSGDVNPMALEKPDIDGLFEPKEVNNKFNSQSERDEELLLRQQAKFQKDQYQKISNDAYQKSVYYDSTRYAAYLDYEQMEYFPEIATALNIMSEESTSLFEDGKMLRIQSDSTRIKNILEHLFENVLQINVTLPYWTRTTCKYGDNFVFLKSEKGKGIIKAVQMKNIEIGRIEGTGKQTIDSIGEDKVLFEWRGQSEKFTEWQIAHFRLITDDKKLPYGTSVLEKVRKVFKQLSLAEDAMMVYRISRAPERRVFKIDVGNIDTDDIESYVQGISNKFKRTPMVNSKDGQIDYRYNMLTQDEDYFIPVRNNMNSTVIDTLQGASNLSDIDDILFLQNKLFAGLQVPKTFLGFEESSGDGKSLAMQDIRFARTINRIQQSMLMELNKIAIIHLYLLGFEDELNNFSLGLSNPSKQGEIMATELLSAKLDAFAKAITPIDGTFAPMSYTEASKKILNKSDDEIILSMKQQYTEKAESMKLLDDNIAMKNLDLGLFGTIDKMYGNEDVEDPNQEPSDMVNPTQDDSGIPNGSPSDMGGDFDDNGPMPGGSDDASTPMDIPDLNEKDLLIHEKINKNINIVNQLLNK